ncbi:MAG: hypothetical protein JWR34_2160 [Mycobacterium sp.]|nr:hypothetical protein [Mycobacterium sp.]
MRVLACVVEGASAGSVAGSTTTDIVSTVFDTVTDTSSSGAVECSDAVFAAEVSRWLAGVPGMVALCPGERLLWLAVVKSAGAGADSEPSDAVAVSSLMVDGSVVVVDDV